MEPPVTPPPTKETPELRGKIHANKRCPFCLGTFIVITPEQTPEDLNPKTKVMHSKHDCPKFGKVSNQEYVNMVSGSRKSRRAIKSKRKGTNNRRRRK